MGEFPSDKLWGAFDDPWLPIPMRVDSLLVDMAPPLFKDTQCYKDLNLKAEVPWPRSCGIPRGSEMNTSDDHAKL